MLSRKLLLKALDGTSTKTEASLPGNVLAPPKLILLNGTLYEYKGSGGFPATNFYHEVEVFQAEDQSPVKSIVEAAGEVH